jgi:hypothetical protein
MKRVPEHVSTAIRKVEPIGGDMVRLYFSIERGGAWEDTFTVLMPLAVIKSSFDFATASAREIAQELAADVRMIQAPVRGMVS